MTDLNPTYAEVARMSLRDQLTNVNLSKETRDEIAVMIDLLEKRGSDFMNVVLIAAATIAATSSGLTNVLEYYFTGCARSVERVKAAIRIPVGRIPS